MKVKLTYFKPDTGTYYSEGEYTSECKHVHEVHGEVALLCLRQNLPGLRVGHSPFIVLINTDHEHNFPQLVL